MFLLVVCLCLCVCVGVGEGRCPAECLCRPLQRLPSVDCSTKRLSALPAGLPQDTAHLNLGFNNISSLTNATFAAVGGVTRLWMNDNAIESIAPGAFHPLAALSWLTLENNLVTHLHPETFSGLQHLFKLVLSGNPLTLSATLPFLRAPTLQILDMDNCGLREIPSRTFENMSDLMTLRLANNSLRSVNLELPALFHLDLHENSIGPSTNRLRLLTPKLLRLDLSSCFFGDFSSSFLSTLPLLEHLDASDNILQSFSLETFQGLPNLKKINLTNNLIGSLPQDILSQNSKLETIDLSNNPLTMSRRSFLNNCSARVIVFNKCRLREMNSGALNGFRNATELHVSDNKLQTICKSVFAATPSLTSIYLDGNKLSSIEVDAFEDLSLLTFLDLSRNPLSERWQRGAEALRSRTLRSLRLAHCSLEALSARALLALPALRVLSLEGNRLRSVEPRVLLGAPLLHVLLLSGNPWDCDCALRALWRWCVGEEDAGAAPEEARDASALRLHPERCPDAHDSACGSPSNRRLSSLPLLGCRENSEEELDVEGDAEWVGAGDGPLRPRAPPDRLAQAPLRRRTQRVVTS